MQTTGNHAKARRTPHSQRAYERYAVNLPGECVLAQGISTPCTVLNICAGGMYVRLENADVARQITAHGLLTLNCRPPDDIAGNERFSFVARIVRIEDGHCGLALSEPASPPVLRLIERVMARRQADPSPARAPAPPPETPDLDESEREAILEDCRQRTLGYLPRLLTEFNSAVREELFHSAEGCRNASEQNAYFMAISALTDRGSAFNDEVIETVGRTLSGNPLRDDVIEEDKEPADGQLSLMADEVVEEWLATTDIISHAERINQGELRGLELRLSVVYGGAIDKDNNPFRPLVFAEAFLDALDHLELDTTASHCCHHVFRRHLAEMCKLLYPELNALLVEKGILPKLPAIPKPVARHRPGTAPAADGAIDERPAPGEQAPAFAETTRADPSHGASSPGGLDVLPAGRDIYSIVNELESLRLDLQQQALRLSGASHPPDRAGTVRPRPGTMTDGPPGPVAASPPSAETGATPGCSVNEILHALDNLRRSPAMLEGEGPGDILTQVEALIRAQSGRSTPIEGPPRNIISVGSRLFSSLLEDRLVSPHVKGWLRRLEIPLLKHALRDASVFTDRDHLGRQIVNRIAQLEVYGDDGGSDHSAIIQQINRLIDALEDQQEIKPAMLEKVLRKLDNLVTLQNEAFAANLGELVAHCGQEQKAWERGQIEENALRNLSPDPDIALPLDGAEGQHWLERVHKLQADTWFMFLDRPEQARRLKLAWISKHRDRYVMVNIRGLRETTLSDRQLARMLRDGSAIALDNADEPALDRAQYTILQQLHQQLLHETTHDPVTDLYNRHEFENRLESALTQQRLAEGSFVFCYLDLDQFRIINETCGSQEGNRLLYDFARQLRDHLDDTAALARLESDDFAILIPDRSSDDIRHRLEGICIEDFRHEDRCYPVSFSSAIVPLGVVTSDERASSLLGLGHDLCKKARAEGLTTVIYSDPAGRNERKQSLGWLEQVNEILNERVPLTLRFQPIVAIDGEHDGDPSPHHSEVLLTVQDDEGRFVSPQEFVIAAEHFHKMPVIDRLVVRRVMSWLREHPGLVAQTGSLAINLSGRSLNDASFREFLLDELRRSEIPAEQICFEVTETAGLESLGEAAGFIGEIRALGHSFALDDFGSGMSSYGYLRQLPVDYLKIDGIFIKNIDKNPEDRAIVRSITEIGHFMGKRIIAEYVENEAILERLREIGVDFAQGFHVGRPRLLSEIEETRLRQVGGSA